MAGEINFGLLDTQAPLRAANAFYVSQNEKRQNKLAELAMRQQEQAMADEQAQREAYKATQGDPNALLQEYANRGMYKQANELRQQQLANQAKQIGMQKDQSVIGKNAAETAKQKLDYLTKSTAALAQNPSYENAQALLSQGVMAGVLSPEEAQQHLQSMPRDPAQIKQIAMQANGQLMTANERMTFNSPKPQQMNLGNRIVTIDMNPNSPTFKQEIASAAVGMNPGQAASLGQSERHFQANQALEREKMANGGKAPAGYRFMPDGSLQAIPGGPADPTQKLNAKPPTEFQGKSATYGARAEQADKIISDLEGKYSPLAVNAKQGLGGTWGIGGALEAGANVLMSKESQKAEQAQRDFVNAVLRQESGAAISPSEFENAKKQYFPQPGDSKELLQQKSNNRKLAIQGFMNNAGPAAFHAPQSQGGNAQSGGIPVSNW